MKQLSYKTLDEQNYKGYLLKEAPERVLQFGGGCFLRGFVDFFIDIMNEKTDFQSKIVICQPIPTGPSDLINKQDGLYTLYLRGFQNGKKVSKKRIISSISRCINPYIDYKEYLLCAENPDLRFIVCNTTEAGIVFDPICQFSDTPATSYPGKLTQFLFHRFKKFGEEKGRGFIILACELINHNGLELKQCVLKYARLWNLGSAFINWIEKENIFCSTLVDRIVTGYPEQESMELNNANNYIDELIDTGEIFGFWVIEGPQSLLHEFPCDKAGLPILITADHTPYKQRKVRILNGAHTAFVLGAYLAGQNIVRDCMEDPVICKFMNQTIYNEIIPTLTLPKEELREFAFSVTERFKNPFIDHALLSISLNSTSKWKARVLPSLKQYVELFHTLPECITASFAFYLAFYKGIRLEDDALIGLRITNEYKIKDDRKILEFYNQHKADSYTDYVHAVCSNYDFWEEDLSLIPHFEERVVYYLKIIEEKGAYEVMKTCIK